MKIIIKGANRVQRGGGWGFDAGYGLMSYRRRISFICKYGSYGFRVARRVK